MNTTNVIAAIGWVGAILVIVSLTSKNPKAFRSCSLAAAIALTVVSGASGIWSSVALNVIVIGINIHALDGMRQRPLLRRRTRLTSIDVSDVALHLELEELHLGERAARVEAMVSGR